ncbi:MAG: hypothetical protein H3C47_16160 [Candidatus Cloacimonetes bacterium]|nr:hypothetical protein [Candidatus Cloacimonadota bacterium]
MVLLPSLWSETVQFSGTLHSCIQDAKGHVPLKVLQASVSEDEERTIAFPVQAGFSIAEAMAELKEPQGIIVARHEEEQIHLDCGTIDVLPAWKFLLNLPM